MATIIGVHSFRRGTEVEYDDVPRSCVPPITASASASATQMPELDGLEASRLIRTRWSERSLRIVAMTANAMEGNRESRIAAGMNDYLSKPIRPEELAAALVGKSGAVAS